MWTVKIFRQYYNTDSNDFEIVEIDYPLTLFITPQAQNPYSAILSLSTPSFNNTVQKIEKPLVDLDISMAAEFGEAVSQNLYEKEIVFVIALFALSIFIIFFLELVILMVILVTHRLKPKLRVPVHKLENQVVQADNGDALQEFSSVLFDVYLSLSENDAHKLSQDVLQLLEPCVSKVCSPLDIPPNLPEEQATDLAIRNSCRFVVFLSRDYINSNLPEAEKIVNRVKDSGEKVSDTVLVVETEQVQRPLCLSQCTALTWSPRHHRQLMSWVRCDDPATLARKERSQNALHTGSEAMRITVSVIELIRHFLWMCYPLIFDIALDAGQSVLYLVLMVFQVIVTLLRVKLWLCLYRRLRRHAPSPS